MSARIHQTLLRVLVHGHVLLALGATVQVLWMSKFIGGAPLVPSVFAGLATLAAYGCMRLFRMNVPGMQDSEQMAWFRENGRAMVAVTLIAGSCACLLLWLLIPRLDAGFWWACVCAVLYVLPASKSSSRLWGLRRIPLLKSFLIAYVWAAMSVLLARAGVQDLEAGDDHLMLFIVQFCFFLAIALVFDIRDAGFDLGSIRTIPQVIGERATRVAAVLLMVVPITMMAALLVIANMDGNTVARNKAFDGTYLGALVGYVLAAVLFTRTTPQRSTLFYGLVLDGLLVLVPVLAWVASIP